MLLLTTIIEIQYATKSTCKEEGSYALSIKSTINDKTEIYRKSNFAFKFKKKMSKPDFWSACLPELFGKLPMLN